MQSAPIAFSNSCGHNTIRGLKSGSRALAMNLIMNADIICRNCNLTHSSPPLALNNLCSGFSPINCTAQPNNFANPPQIEMLKRQKPLARVSLNRCTDSGPSVISASTQLHRLTLHTQAAWQSLPHQGVLSNSLTRHKVHPSPLMALSAG